jgi:hypothetical protein
MEVSMQCDKGNFLPKLYEHGPNGGHIWPHDNIHLPKLYEHGANVGIGHFKNTYNQHITTNVLCMVWFYIVTYKPPKII